MKLYKIITLVMLAFASHLSEVKAFQIGEDGFSLTFDKSGKIISVQDTSTAHFSTSGFCAVLDNGKGEEKNVQFTPKAYNENILTIGNENITLSIEVKDATSYLSFRIVKVEEQFKNQLLRLSFYAPKLNTLATYPTDWMCNLQQRGKSKHSIDWSWIWSRNDKNPIGGFVMFAYDTEQMHDDILLKVWVNEGLPHPKIDEEWTEERAKQHLAQWQAKFTDQSTMIISPTDLKDIYSLADYAERMGMKKIYLHTDIWRGEYWPIKNSFLTINKKIFPKGIEDFSKFADYCKSKDMGLAIHTVSCAIARQDPDYAKNAYHADLATWSRGEIVDAIDKEVKTIRFKPQKGTIYPKEIGYEWHGPNKMPSYMHTNIFQIGDEIIRAGYVTDTDKDIWTLTHCTRGYYDSKASSHNEKTPSRGLYTAYGQTFVAEIDSPLADEVARRYGEFCSANGVTHAEADAAEIYCYKPYGANKFSWKTYENFSTPLTSNTSSGTPLRFQIEYWFYGSKHAIANQTGGGLSGGNGIPVILEHPERNATTPYEIFLKSSERLKTENCNTFNLIRPVPMFGVSQDVLNNYGLTSYIEEKLPLWREISRKISEQQREEIKEVFSAPYKSPFNQARNQRGTYVIYRPEKQDEQLTLTPLRIVNQPRYDMNWGWGQEYGPIVPWQYISLNEKVSISNPYVEQSPELLLKVKYELASNAKINRKDSDKVASNENVIEAYQIGAGQSNVNRKTNDDTLNPNKNEISLMPKANEDIVLSKDNKTSSAFRQQLSENSWGVNTSMLGSRGVAVKVVGDGSNALLVVRISGRGARDYVVPIDFKGEREIIVPCGEESWSMCDWGWQHSTMHMKYGTIRNVSAHLGMVPANTSSRIVIKDIRVLAECNTKIDNLQIKTKRGSLKVLGSISSGQYIWYKGGDTADVLDSNMNYIHSVKVQNKNFQIPNGSSELSIKGDSESKGYIAMQYLIFAKGNKIIIPE